VRAWHGGRNPSSRLESNQENEKRFTGLSRGWQEAMSSEDIQGDEKPPRNGAMGQPDFPMKEYTITEKRGTKRGEGKGRRRAVSDRNSLEKNGYLNRRTKRKESTPQGDSIMSRL